MLLDTLNIVSSSFNGSQHTEKLESSEHLYMSSDKDNGSGSTIRVDSNGIEMGSGVLLHRFFSFFTHVVFYCIKTPTIFLADQRGRKRRVKTSTQQSISSTTKDISLQDKIKVLLALYFSLF